METEFDIETDKLLEEHIAALKSHSTAHLRSLPDMSENEVKVQSKNVMVITWRENLPEESIFIIGHISWQNFIYGTSKADGFIVEKDGLIRDATSQEWSEYGGL